MAINRNPPPGKRLAAAAQTPVRPGVQQKPAAAAAARSAQKASYARQNDQAPAPSLDATWDNLHPARIWPD